MQPVEKQIRSSLGQTLEIRDGNAASIGVCGGYNKLSLSGQENSRKSGSMKECHMVL